MTLFNYLKNRLARVLDASLDQYPGIELSDADKVEILSSWDAEVSKTCVSVQEIFSAMDVIKIVIEIIDEEQKDIEQYYAGHSIQYHMAYLLELDENLWELYWAVIAFTVQVEDRDRVLRELDEAFWFEISYNLHGSSLSS
ncbi:uncharacterized protein FIESC28_05092 [Fusarium coffeatum]|uniref:Uncharacterized protein n=1 Tax=Fusarium coffeatum TaxID=231269 RepID=A0A366RX00_9HYPO|nr:uncharacterized protein FIESC28_05092 [Fusarium coffeatum]RBR20940.1 hypothetical protein FIESC28_05092 [Fusarium coffeatum]